jgi:hypothetical protein
VIASEPVAARGSAAAPTSPPIDDFDSLVAAITARNARPGPGAGVGARAVLVRFAPLALIEGCWLWPLAGVRRSEGELGGAVLDALHAVLGAGDPARSAAQLYRALIAGAGVEPPPSDPNGCARDPRWSALDVALADDARRLALDDSAAHRAVGYHAAWGLCGLPRPLLSARAELGASPYWDERAGGHPAVLARARRLVESCIAERGAHWDRVWEGACHYVDAVARWEASLTPLEVLTPRAAMLRLVSEKARHAHGHHAAIMLEGRSVDAHLEPDAIDAEVLLDALARSPHVTPGDPDSSPLLGRSTAFGGSMFGVFDDRELAVLRAWIAALPSAEVRRPSSGAAPQERAHQPDRVSQGRPALPVLDLPELYLRLLRARPDDPEADRLASSALDRALHAVPRLRASGAQALPTSEAALRRWVDAGLWRQVHPGGPAIDLESGLSREDATWLLLQLMPAALIDGAWLEGVVRLSPSASPVVAPLFRIYRDELGAGVPLQHHGNVMRRALAREGVALPPCDAPALTRTAGLTREAFSLPVLWLAIARLTPSHLPELLGLNLAVEMAGIGDVYGRAIRALRRLGMDPLFFELHETIDNGSSGHTRWSVEAIVSYMSALEAAGDARFVEEAWARLWRGHAAYAVASGPLVRRAALELGPRLSMRWLSRGARALARLGRR